MKRIRNVAAGVLGAALCVASTSVGAIAVAKDRHKHHATLAERESRKHPGWVRAANGSWVQPVFDPRYPGASPSGGRGVSSKDDMDTESFKPAAMLGSNEHRGGTTTVYYERNDTGLRATSPSRDTVDVTVERRDASAPYVDDGSVYSQESTTRPQ